MERDPAPPAQTQTAAPGTSTLATSVDVSPSAFLDVPDAEHLSGLRALYAALNPDKMSQIDAMWAKFGTSIWEALSKKYPEVDVSTVCPAVPFMNLR